MEGESCGCSKRVTNPTVDTAELDIANFAKLIGSDPTYKCGLVDFRTVEEYYSKHIQNSTNIPWTEFRERAQELPPKRLELALLVPTNRFTEVQKLVGCCTDEEKIKEDFRSRDYVVRFIFADSAELWSRVVELGLVEEKSDRSVILWQPSPCLGGTIEVIERLRESSGLPKAGSAIDLACGSGRDGIFLSLRGWKTLNFDYSGNQIIRAKEMATIYKVHDLVELMQLDIEKNAQQLSAYKTDLVNVSRYLHRPLWDDIKNLILPGGFIVYHTFMETCSKPRRPQFKLNSGELAKVFAPPEWEIVEDKVVTISDERETSWFVARKRSQ